VTYEDIFCQILAEAMGKKVDDVRHMSNVIHQMVGSRGKLDQVIPDEKAHELLATLRTELPGVRRWLVEGSFLAEADIAAMRGQMH